MGEALDAEDPDAAPSALGAEGGSPSLEESDGEHARPDQHGRPDQFEHTDQFEHGFHGDDVEPPEGPVPANPARLPDDLRKARSRAAVFQTGKTAIDRRASGEIFLRCLAPVGAPPRSLAHALDQWAARRPDAPFLHEGHGGQRRSVSYGEAAQASHALAQSFLDRGVKPGDVVMSLGEPSIAHAIVMFGAMKAGALYAPAPPSVTRSQRGHRALRRCFDALGARVVFTEDAGRDGEGLNALPLGQILALAARGEHPRVLPLERLTATPAGDWVAERMEQTGPLAPALAFLAQRPGGQWRIAVMSHGAAASALSTAAALWPDPEAAGETVLASALAWSHPSGLSHLYAALSVGAALAVPGGAEDEADWRWLADAKAQVWGASPAQVCALSDALEADAPGARPALKRLRQLVIDGPALPAAELERFHRLCLKHGGERIAVTPSHCARETLRVAMAPAAAERADVIGPPAPGVEFKLVPHGDCYELRVRSGSLMAHYLDMPDDTQAAFDGEGFLRCNDAVRLIAPEDPAAGMTLERSLADDFRLSGGAPVPAGVLAGALVQASEGLIAHCVIGSPGADEAVALVWLNETLGSGAPAGAVGGDGAPDEPGPRERVREAMRTVNRWAHGPGRRVARALVMDKPLSSAWGEIDETGALNRAVILDRRSEALELLHLGQDAAIVHAEST